MSYSAVTDIIELRFSALQRAEIAEIVRAVVPRAYPPADRFSALQRAEIAEIVRPPSAPCAEARVSVLFNEPKLLKFDYNIFRDTPIPGFSALQRAEIAEIVRMLAVLTDESRFQCSSTSRNC